MLRLIISRLIQLPVILTIIFLLTFLMVWVLPGDMTQTGEKNLSPTMAEARQRAHYSDSPGRFLGHYLEDIFLRGDFGYSVQYERNITEIIGRGLPVSLLVGAVAMIFAVLLGMAAGTIGGVKQGTWMDLGSLTVVLIGISLPSFLVAAILLAIFGDALGWTTLSNWSWPGYEFWTMQWWADLGRLLGRVIPAAVAEGLAPAAYIARLTRLGLADVMGSDFIRTARAKGVPPRRVIFNHGLKVASLPVLSFLGPATAYTLTGSFVVETVFNLPGLGRFFIEAVLKKDQKLILSLVLVYSTMLIVLNLLVDIAYAWVDPRIEL